MAPVLRMHGATIGWWPWGLDHDPQPQCRHALGAAK